MDMAFAAKCEEPLRIGRKHHPDEGRVCLHLAEDRRHCERGLPPGAVALVCPGFAQRLRGEERADSQPLAELGRFLRDRTTRQEARRRDFLLLARVQPLIHGNERQPRQHDDRRCGSGHRDPPLSGAAFAFPLLDLASADVVEVGEGGIPAALVDTAVDPGPARVEAAIIRCERHIQDLAQRIGKCHLGALLGRGLVVGDARDQQRDDALGPPGAGEACDLVIDELAGAGRRRAQNDQLSGVIEMALDRLVVLGPGKILLVPKHVQPAVGQRQVTGRLIIPQRLLQPSGENLVLARIADERVMRHGSSPCA